MNILKTYKSIVAIAILTMLFVSKPAVAGQCYKKTDDFTPYQSAKFGGVATDLDGQVTPAMVYTHLERLQEQLIKLNLPKLSQPKVLPIQVAIPRTNFLLSYDLHILLQIWHQENSGIISHLPEVTMPKSIEPKHVYRWIDASFAFVDCSLKIDVSKTADTPMDSELKNKNEPFEKGYLETGKDLITPLDVFYLLDEVLGQVISVLSINTLEQYISHRLVQSHYLLQQYSLANGRYQVVDWSLLDNSNVSNANINLLYLNLLGQLKSLSGISYLKSNLMAAGLSEYDLTRLRYVSLTLLHSELSHLSKVSQYKKINNILGLSQVLGQDEQIRRLEDMAQLLAYFKDKE
jgi:hypothetical protein